MKAALLLLVASIALAHAESVTFKPSQDSDIYAYFDGPSYSPFDLNIGASGAAQAHSHHALVRFDLSTLAIPAAEIGSAKLRLFSLVPDSANGGGLRPGNVAVHRQNTAWSVSGLKWNHIQSHEKLGAISVTATNVWVELDVTALVTEWTSGATANHGFVLKPESETLEPLLNVLFAAMEITAYAPQLVITRAVPTPVLSITSGGGAITLEWPVSGSEGWTLQSAPSPAGPWGAETTPASIIGGTFYMTPAANPPSRFFRLMKP